MNPWEIPQILEVGPDGKKPTVAVQSSTNSTIQDMPQNTPSTPQNTPNDTDTDVPTDSTCLENDVADSCVECPDPDGCFQQLKLQGNELVQKVLIFIFFTFTFKLVYY